MIVKCNNRHTYCKTKSNITHIFLSPSIESQRKVAGCRLIIATAPLLRYHLLKRSNTICIWGVAVFYRAAVTTQFLTIAYHLLLTIRHATNQAQQPIKQRQRVGRAAGHIQVHRQHATRRHNSAQPVWRNFGVARKRTTTNRTCATRNHQSRRRHCFPRFDQS